MPITVRSLKIICILSFFTSIFQILMSEKPEYNDKIIEAYLLAPAVFMTHAPHPIFILTSLAEDIEAIFHWLGTRTIELEDCYRDFF